MKKIQPPPPDSGTPIAIIILAAFAWVTAPMWDVPITVQPSPPEVKEPKPSLVVKLLRVGAEMAVPATTILRAFD